jgi:aspartokinase-like uncharacterized kinase
MQIVKLGGSLSRESTLPRWLEMLAEVGGGRVIVVPGGGGFADQAREAQAWWQLDDLAGHNMAVLGMAQTALMMQALCPTLELASDETQLQEVLRRDRVALWLPLDLLRSQPDQLTHWGVTSDSLALWLASRLCAERLLLVKAGAIDASHTLAQLGEDGVVDIEFAGRARSAAFPIDLLDQTEIVRARRLLASSSGPGAVGGG